MTLSRKELRRLAKLERKLPIEADEVELRAFLERTRPRTRGACIDAARPCPFVSCRYNLYLDVTEFGGLKLNFPGAEVDELEETCALDVAEKSDGDGVTLERAGALLNVTRERIRQIQDAATAKLEQYDALLPAGGGVR